MRHTHITTDDKFINSNNTRVTPVKDLMQAISIEYKKNGNRDYEN